MELVKLQRTDDRSPDVCQQISTHSGLWPTSTKAMFGAVSAEKAALMCGKAALTSGHHDSPVSGRFDVVNVMKKGASGFPGS